MILVREKVDLYLNGEPLTTSSEEKIGKFLESCGRVCYRTEEKTTDTSYKKFLDTIIKSGHESVIEHVSISARILTNRGITHELVRHRLGSYSQESTRYCNYSGSRFGSEITFIIPVWVSNKEVESFSLEDYKKSSKSPSHLWWKSIYDAERSYFELLELGWKAEQAREVLPNSLATTITATYNIREWRHILRQRLDKGCHPQMRYLMTLVGEELLKTIPFFVCDVVSFDLLDSIRFNLRGGSCENR